MAIPEAIKDLRELEVPQYGPRVWKSFMEKYNCQFVCELGVREGYNFEPMIAHRPKLAVAVDAWINDGIISRNDLASPQEFLDKMYEAFKTQNADKPFVQICREYTFDAVKHFPDEYFDLVYVDADHTYKACLKDLEDWYPKVKKERFMIGDDYRRGRTNATKVKLGVIEAVQEFSKKHNLTIYELPQNGWAIIKP